MSSDCRMRKLVKTLCSSTKETDSYRPAPVVARSFTQEVETRITRLGGNVVTVLGFAGYGDHTYPILASVSEDSSANKPWVLISGGVHGDEVAGVYAALAFLETSAKSLSSHFRIAVLPCINPSGFEQATLETANGANLNRLFGTDSQQAEVAAVDSWLNELNVRFLATFDLHEVYPFYRGEGFVETDNPRSCYLYETQSNPSKRIGRSLIDSLPPSFEICRWPFIYKDRNFDGVVSYPEGCFNPVYAQQTTFDAYLQSRFTTHSFTFETPMGWPLLKRIEAHLIWLNAAFSRLQSDRTG